MIKTMAASSHTQRLAVAHGRLRVFSLYVDFPGSIRARWANCSIGQFAGENWITSTELWRLDSLATSASLHKMINGEAARADILLVTVSCLDYRQHDLMMWLESLALWSTDRQDSGLLVGVFGDDDRHASELKWTLEQCRNSSRAMNRDFIWHQMETGATENFVWLKEHLNQFLGRKQARTEKPLISGLPAGVTPLPAVPVPPL